MSCYSDGIMGAFAGKPGQVKAGQKICPTCHRPIYGGQTFTRHDDHDGYHHSDCFWVAYPGLLAAMEAAD